VQVLKEVLVLGKESAGKSQLIASLSGKSVYAANFRGSTVTCEAFRTGDLLLIDTPGIQRSADTAAMQEAMEHLRESDCVLLVTPATHLRLDLEELLPLLHNKRGVVAVTFWDQVSEAERTKIQYALGKTSLATVRLDARHPLEHEVQSLRKALADPGFFPEKTLAANEFSELRRAPRTASEPSVAVKMLKGLMAISGLMLPGAAVVWIANSFATKIDPLVRAALEPVVRHGNYLFLSGDYGLLTMGPLLFVWAVPVVVLYAIVLGVYKASGLIDAISDAGDPLLRPFGLSGRDLPRILMGFGCNVPAVIGTRSCATSSRNTCISAIAFGSACSYQFGATLGVFSAVGKPGLVLPYLGYLGITTLLYSRVVAGPAQVSPFNILVAENRAPLVLPDVRSVWREASGSIRSFFRTSLPIFFLITLIASLLDALHLFGRLARVFGPVMKVFRLPANAALGILLASIRKDGLLLLSKTPMSGAQVLTAVYLAGVLLPCLVTLLTIAREKSWRFALKLAGGQALAACLFSILLAWLGTL
jgi:ferrous iron transport protein B